LINYYLIETKQIKNKEEFLTKYNVLGASRQTRVLGLWVRLYKVYNKPEYLKYINTTWYWLEKNLKHPCLIHVKNFYDTLIPVNKRNYDY